jgi:hypothetical protein
MATTTNYGWTTPDDTALVKDGAAAIRTLGSSVDTTTKALNPSTTLGDIEYRSSTANTNTRLAIGSTGNVLTVSGGVPAWVAPAGGGKVLQVVTASTTTSKTVASTSYTDTELTATITPTSATSTILVMVSQYSYQGRVQQSINANMRILRDSTVIYGDSFYSSRLTVIGSPTGVTEIYLGLYTNYIYRDSPATTSAITYKTQGKVSTTADSASVIYQDNSTPSTITLLEIGA